jgi:hypothetical protein
MRDTLSRRPADSPAAVPKTHQSAPIPHMQLDVQPSSAAADKQQTMLEKLFGVQPDPSPSEIDMYAAAAGATPDDTARWFEMRRARMQGGFLSSHGVAAAPAPQGQEAPGGGPESQPAIQLHRLTSLPQVSTPAQPGAQAAAVGGRRGGGLVLPASYGRDGPVLVVAVFTSAGPLGFDMGRAPDGAAVRAAARALAVLCRACAAVSSPDTPLLPPPQNHTKAHGSHHGERWYRNLATQGMPVGVAVCCTVVAVGFCRGGRRRRWWRKCAHARRPRRSARCRPGSSCSAWANSRARGWSTSACSS